MMLKFHAGRWWAGDKRLTDREATMLFAVMFRRFVYREELIEMFWPDPDSEPEFAWSTISVVAFHLRAKLKPLGWDVRATPGSRKGGTDDGYRLHRLPLAEPLKLAA